MAAITIINIMCDKCTGIQQDGQYGTETNITSAREEAQRVGWVYMVDPEEPYAYGNRRLRIDICPSCQEYATLSDEKKAKW